MNSIENGVCFLQPHWRLIARGLSPEAWFQNDEAVGTGGIVNPQPTKLRRGQRLYRFASSTAPSHAQIGGGWWVDFENFSLIATFANENGYSLADAARLMLAVPFAWSRVDRLVHAILEVPLGAYTGLGNPAEGGGRSTPDRGTRWVPTQHRPVRQLYIPGLFKPGIPAKDQLYNRAFPAPTIEFAIGNRRRV